MLHTVGYLKRFLTPFIINVITCCCPQITQKLCYKNMILYGEMTCCRNLMYFLWLFHQFSAPAPATTTVKPWLRHNMIRPHAVRLHTFRPYTLRPYMLRPHTEQPCLKHPWNFAPLPTTSGTHYYKHCIYKKLSPFSFTPYVK